MATTQQQARAMAYALVDKIETRALRLMADNPSLTDKAHAMALVIQTMAKESGNE